MSRPSPGLGDLGPPGTLVGLYSGTRESGVDRGPFRQCRPSLADGFHKPVQNLSDVKIVEPFVRYQVRDQPSTSEAMRSHLATK
jgi:hypothetical protein